MRLLHVRRDEEDDFLATKAAAALYRGSEEATSTDAVDDEVLLFEDTGTDDTKVEASLFSP